MRHRSVLYCRGRNTNDCLHLHLHLHLFTFTFTFSLRQFIRSISCTSSSSYLFVEETIQQYMQAICVNISTKQLSVPAMRKKFCKKRLSNFQHNILSERVHRDCLVLHCPYASRLNVDSVGCVIHVFDSLPLTVRDPSLSLTVLRSTKICRVFFEHNDTFS